MFVQIIEMKVPYGQISKLRHMIEQEYMPALRDRPGFIRADLLEQVDDRNETLLIAYWESHADLEATNNTGVLAGSTTSIAARIPGLRIQRQSYVVDVTTEISRV